MKAALGNIVLLIILQWNFSIELRAQHSISFGFNTGYISSDFTIETNIFSNLDKALQNPAEVMAVSISATEKNLPEIKRLTKLKFLYLDATFTSDNYYLNKPALAAFFNVLAQMPSLEFISVYDAKLLEFARSVKHLKGIKFNRFNIPAFQNYIHELPELEIIIVNDPSLKSIPVSFAGLKKMKQLEIYSTALEHLPEFAGDPGQLLVIKMITGKVAEIPPSYSTLKNLRYFKITGTCYFKEFPHAIFGMEKLQELFIDVRIINSLPPELSELKELRILHFNDCERISRIPQSYSTLTNLSEIYFSNANRLNDIGVLSNTIRPLTIMINRCNYIRIAEMAKDLKNLRALVVPSNILPNEMKRLKMILPEEKIITKDF